MKFNMLRRFLKLLGGVLTTEPLALSLLSLGQRHVYVFIAGLYLCIDQGPTCFNRALKYIVH